MDKKLIVFGLGSLLKQAAVLSALFFSLAVYNSRATFAAETSDFKTVETFALYGAGAGTVVGLATVPFSGNIRTMFIGSSIGLFLGIIVGVYHINNRDNPQNPFNGSLRSYPAEDPHYLPEESMSAPDKAPGAPWIMANYPVFRF